MNPDDAQRRRVAVALAITVIAVPAAVLLNRGGDDASAPPATVVGTVAADGAAAPTTSGGADRPVATDVMGTPPVAFLEGDETAGENDPATIAIPRVPESINGTASFSHDIRQTDQCQVLGAPFNAAVTVTNLDNSRSVRCFASIGGPEPDNDVVMHADAFLQIADLTDAPVPVQITW